MRKIIILFTYVTVLIGQSINVNIPSNLQFTTSDGIIEVPIVVSSISSSMVVISYQFELIYDSNEFEALEVLKSNTLTPSDWSVLSNLNTVGQVNIAAAGANELSGDGNLIIIKLKGKNQQSNSNLTIQNFMFNGGTPLANVTSGSIIVGVNELDRNIPTEFLLSTNYPNPFNPTTKIEYSLPSKEYVILKIYDIMGNEISVLENEQKEAGKYQTNFDASALTSGVYIYSLQAGNFYQSHKMLLIK
ncbi:MAG: T9SS type A sorting domain-containing protein [Melioribacteraceae bacterium]|nr:T9SS type A sorting domain-containing protein [Melioribacteraceae bacterium]